MADRRPLVIGFDALDPGLLSKWMEDGAMPNFARLAQKAAWGDVENPRGLEGGSVWPTFYHGKLPGRQPQHDATRVYDPKTYEIRTYRPDELTEPYIWNHLSDAGRRVCLIDANYTFTPDAINGIVVHDWGTHCPAEPGSVLQFKTYPDSLAKEIKRTFGADPLGGHLCDDLAPRSLDELADFTTKLIARAKTRTAMAEALWHREPWDFFFVCYSEAHCIGHHAWHLHDPQLPDYDAAMATALGNPLERIYRELDQQLGALLKLAGDDVVAVAYCGHGMGPSVSATRLLDKILARLEGRPLKDKTAGVEGKLRGTWRALSPGLQKSLEPLKRRIWKRVVKNASQGDRPARKFFEVIATDATGGVRINLAGRDPQGFVQPGAEYEALLDQLTHDLAEIVDCDTGEALVSEILRTDAHYQGPYRDRLPDLLVSWNRANRHTPIRSVSSDKIGTIEHDQHPPRTGDHTFGGRVFCAGPGVPSGHLNQALRAANLAPTFAEMLRAPLDDSDGTAIASLLQETTAVAETGE